MSHKSKYAFRYFSINRECRPDQEGERNIPHQNYAHDSNKRPAPAKSKYTISIMEYPNYYDDVNRLHNIYNSLGDVYEASEIVSSRPNLLPALASLLARYGLARKYDIRLNHKHFNIYEGEMVISFMGRNSTLSVVCNNDELPEEMLANEGVIPVPGHIVVPSEFLVKDGQAIPYEFAYAAPERERKT